MWRRVLVASSEVLYWHSCRDWSKPWKPTDNQCPGQRLWNYGLPNTKHVLFY